MQSILNTDSSALHRELLMNQTTTLCALRKRILFSRTVFLMTAMFGGKESDMRLSQRPLLIGTEKKNRLLQTIKARKIKRSVSHTRTHALPHLPLSVRALLLTGKIRKAFRSVHSSSEVAVRRQFRLFIKRAIGITVYFSDQS